MKRIGLVTVTYAGVAVLLWASPAVAADNCKAKVDKKSGLIEISASNVDANPVWGAVATAIETPFHDAVSCATGGKLKKCHLADPDTQAAKTPPAGCTVFVSDDSVQTCAVFIRGCTPQPRETAPDGVVQIDQARALAGGVTEGDTPGFPVTISEAGSYRLTGELDVTSVGDPNPENLIAIQVSASYVEVDLNGFAILGPVTGCPSSCTPSGGTGDGIYGTGSSLKVRNGTISGMGYYGLRLGSTSVIENMRLRGNGGGGIDAGGYSVVRNCQVYSNGGTGISVDSVSVVTGNLVSSNNSWGIFTGIGPGGYDSSIISENTVKGSAGTGIGAGLGTNVQGNSVYGSDSYGLYTGSGCGYGNNVFFSNNGGDAAVQVNGGVDLGGNRCGDHACP